MCNVFHIVIRLGLASIGTCMHGDLSAKSDAHFDAENAEYVCVVLSSMSRNGDMVIRT
jgi:hypothetical protein